jgi:hypothetical protein
MRSLQPILTGSPKTDGLISRAAERVQQDGRWRNLIAAGGTWYVRFELGYRTVVYVVSFDAKDANENGH